MVKLPDISDEDKAAIAAVEAELREVYAAEASGVVDRDKKKALNAKHRELVAAAHAHRQAAIDADPKLKKLQKDTLQFVGDN